MTNMNRSIDTNSMKIMEFVSMLAEDRFLIPTFQREFVWKPEDIIYLWDSIYRFYPIGSLLYWVTDSYLNTHRQIGGYVFPNDEDTIRRFDKWAYILDGQQRATSLLVSLFGGNGMVREHEHFDYTLYFDATDGTFFFVHELIKRQIDTNPSFLIRLRDIPQYYDKLYGKISSEPDFNRTISNNLTQIHHVFQEYRILLICIHGVDIAGVCDIFERINNGGAKLESMDIWIARTFRNDPTIIFEK